MRNQNEGKWEGAFTFIQGADTQFGLIDRYIHKIQEPNWDKEIKYLRLAIQKINELRPKPRFFVICGDLVDAFPNEDSKEIRTAQINDLKEVLKEVDPEIKLVCVCGNHDVGDEPTEQSIESYKSEFGEDYFSFWVQGCKFIVLNSQIYFNSKNVAELRQKQDEWLNEELIDDPQNQWKHAVVFQHIPLFVSDPNEPADKYFNIEPVQRKNLLERLKKSNVKKVFCGHYHKNAGGYYEDIEVVVTSAIGAQLGQDKHGFRVVQVNENEINHEYVPVSDEVN